MYNPGAPRGAAAAKAAPLRNARTTVGTKPKSGGPLHPKRSMATPTVEGALPGKFARMEARYGCVLMGF